MRVPHQIIQFWDCADRVPERIQRAMRTWMERPGFSYRRFDDAQARQFVLEHFAGDVADAYERAAHPVLKADLFRYAALSVLGGIYIDADDICVAFPQQIIDRCPGLTLVRKFNGVVSNNFIVCAPDHPLLRQATERTAANILQRVSNNIWEVSGPLVIDRLLRGAPSGVEVLDLDEFRRWIGSSRPEGGQVHWSDFQRRHSIFTDPIDPQAPGLFDLIEKIPVPEGTDGAAFRADGLERRNRVMRLTEAAGVHLVSQQRIAIVDDHDFAVSRWFYPLQLTLRICCVFERVDGLDVPPPLNFGLKNYRAFEQQASSGAGLDVIVVLESGTGLSAEQLRAALRPGGMVVALGTPFSREALTELGMRVVHESADGAVHST